MSTELKHRLRLGVKTDEIDQDLERALRVVHELGLAYVEVNSLWGKLATELSAEEAHQARRLLDAFGVRVSMVGSLVFKTLPVRKEGSSGFEETVELRKHLELLKRTIGVAHGMGTDLVQIFPSQRDDVTPLDESRLRVLHAGQIPEAVLESVCQRLAAACELAEREEVKLALENERKCYGGTGQGLRMIVDAVGSPILKVNWDPANNYASGETTWRGGYEAIKPWIVHLHLKDAKVHDRATGLFTWEAVGCGETDCRGQLSALIEDRFDGVVSLETHWSPPGKSKEEATRISFRNMLRIIDELS